MKAIRNLVCMALLVVVTQSCESDDPVNPQTYIQKAWTLGSGYVKKAGTNMTTDYLGLTLTFNSNGTYQVTGGKKLFKPTGTWAWVGEGITQFKLDGDLPVDVSEVSENTLHFTFTLDAAHVNANGRTEAMVGAYDVLLTVN
jgi:hypothetical protein